jgi:arginase
MTTEINRPIQGTQTAMQEIRLIKVPFGVGAGRPGTEQGAAGLIESGLPRIIRSLGKTCEQVLISGEWISNATRESASQPKHLELVQEMCAQTAEQVAKALDENTFPLVVGGDHSVTIGVVAGLQKRYRHQGLIWFDAHPSLLTEDTSPTGNVNRMALSAVLDRIVGLASAEHIRKENIVLIGIREVLPAEREWIKAEGIAYFSMHEIDRMGIQKVVEAAVQIAGRGTEGIHVSFDADCMDPLEAPGVGEPVSGGLFYREAHFALELLADTGLITSMDVTEYNPLVDDQRRTGKLLAGLIASLLGKKII